MTTLRIIGERPTHTPDGDFPLPADSLIFNAPRPLFGNPTWHGEFRHGVFYAAVRPDDQNAIRDNTSLDGWLCQWVSWDDVMAWAREYYAEFDINPDECHPDDVRTAFIQNCAVTK